MSNTNQNQKPADTSSKTSVAATGTEAAAPAAEKTPAVRQPIINGRMPVAVVALARFGSQKDSATKAKADLFGTTVGKIDDIAKNRNFAYVTADFKPTQAQKDDGAAWLARHPGGEPAELIKELKAMQVASPEDAAAFEATRTAARGQSNKNKDGSEADAGGGNRQGKKSDKAPANAAATGDALLS